MLTDVFNDVRAAAEELQRVFIDTIHRVLRLILFIDRISAEIFYARKFYKTFLQNRKGWKQKGATNFLMYVHTYF